MPTSELRDAMAGFLARFPWDWFLTLTFRDPVPSFTAHRRFSRFARDIEKAANLPVAWFRADEYGPAGGRLHLHALMINTAALSRLHWMDQWNHRNGYARILAFDPALGAAHYCAKYLTKNFGDWDLSDNLDGFHSQQPALFTAARQQGMPRNRA
jgi:hypothetical protein